MKTIETIKNILAYLDRVDNDSRAAGRVRKDGLGKATEFSLKEDSSISYVAIPGDDENVLPRTSGKITGKPVTLKDAQAEKRDTMRGKTGDRVMLLAARTSLQAALVELESASHEAPADTNGKRPAGKKADAALVA